MIPNAYRLFFWILPAALIIGGCQSDPLRNAVVRELPLLCQEGGMPNLFVSESGRTYLSWIEFLNDSTDALYYAALEPRKWSSPRTIALGTNWFVNWADFPSLATYDENDNFLAAHWLQMRGTGTYEYDIHIGQSQNGGRLWIKSLIPHDDSIAAEHGFVSLLPIPNWKMFAVWLDGRKMVTEDIAQTSEGHGHDGPMTLRCAIFDTQGNLSFEFELDDKVCECCQTDAVWTSGNIVVAYRDLTDENVRDISIVRTAGGKWTTPKTLYPDNWKISGCPVNGPALAAIGDTLVVSWFSAPEGVAQVKAAFSFDGGDNFQEPVRVDDGDPLGRVDVVMLSQKEALVSWVERTGDRADIRVVRVNAKKKISQSVAISDADASRMSGFPIMEKNDDRIVFAWTEVDSTTTVVKSAYIDRR